MNCAEFDRFAEAYVDGEFDPAGRAEMDTHLERCEECNRHVASLETCRALVRSSLAPVSAPHTLKQSIRAVVRRQRSADPVLTGWSLAALGIALLAALIMPKVWQNDTSDLLGEEPETAPIVEATIDWHQRNLPVEVTGPDTEAIRQWFDDKVDFPVRLPTFASGRSTSVLGGRLSQINNRSAAHVLYEVNGTKVSVVLFQLGEELHIPVRRGPQPFDYFWDTRNGYNVALFTDNGVSYAIATELPQPNFSRLMSNAILAE